MQNIQALWEKGLELQRNGDLLGAKKIYQDILDLDPYHVDSLYLSSAIAVQESDLQLAKSLLERVITSNPNHVDSMFNLAVILDQLGESDEALKQYDIINVISPNHLQAIFNRSTLLAKLGRLDEAAAGFQRAVELKPDFITAQRNYEQLKGAISGKQTKSVETRDLFTQFHENGLWFYESKQPEKAIEQFNQALAIEPNSAEVLHNKGIALEKIGQLEEALKCYRATLLLNQNLAPTHNNIGNVLRELGFLDEASEHFEKALLLDPQYSEAYSNYGWTLQCMHQFDRALAYYEKALILNPKLMAARFNLSLCQLTLGDLDSGWINYESRTEQAPYKKMKIASAPQWFGNESLSDKVIYVYAEQGLGDTIQFSRYLALLADQGAKVLFQTQGDLLNLFRNLKGVSKLLTPGESVPAYHFHSPLMSLPLAFKTSLDTIPNKVPYIHVDKDKKNYWKEKLKNIQKPKIGLVWHGGIKPDQPELWTVNQRRNIPLSEMSKIQSDEFHFISLQKGKDAEHELSQYQNKCWPNGNFSNFSSELNDFTDTAALISELDLVVSVDTSTAHLVGALGKPIWILNRYDSCWRWLTSGDTSNWYPTAKLYRQKHDRNWATVIQDVKRDLLDHFKSQ